jgi:hypothetical protein
MPPFEAPSSGHPFPASDETASNEAGVGDGAAAAGGVGGDNPQEALPPPPTSPLAEATLATAASAAAALSPNGVGGGGGTGRRAVASGSGKATSSYSTSPKDWQRKRGNSEALFIEGVLKRQRQEERTLEYWHSKCSKWLAMRVKKKEVNKGKAWTLDERTRMVVAARLKGVAAKKAKRRTRRWRAPDLDDSDFSTSDDDEGESGTQDTDGDDNDDDDDDEVEIVARPVGINLKKPTALTKLPTSGEAGGKKRGGCNQVAVWTEDLKPVNDGSSESAWAYNKRRKAYVLAVPPPATMRFAKLELDPGVYKKLYPHQRVAVQWMAGLHVEHIGGIFAHQMGMGEFLLVLTIYLLITSQL